MERPLCLRVDLTPPALASFRRACDEAGEEPLAALADRLAQTLGAGPHLDYNAFSVHAQAEADTRGVKLTARRQKLLQTALAGRDETAAPVVRKVHKPAKADRSRLHGRYETPVDGKRCVVEYEPDADLRDTEQIPLLEDGGIAAFIAREVWPHVPDAWVDEDATRVGYEISFTRYFYKPQPLRSLAEIRADILALERETDGLLAQILGAGGEGGRP